jgi:hypothetical protein
MTSGTDRIFAAFDGVRCLGRGALPDVAASAKAALDAGTAGPVLIFDEETSRTVEVDFRGTAAEVKARLTPPPAPPQPPRGPGRPKLGVVAREVTLLPSHWEWLGSQPGGASVALRKLVEEARRANEGQDRLRHAQEAAYRFMTTMAGDRPNYEEALRALYAGAWDRFGTLVADWPRDIRDHVLRLSDTAFNLM